MKQQTPYDPTAGLRLPAPLTAFELDALRPQPVVTTAPQPATAQAIAYASGIKELGPVVERIEALERKVKWLEQELVQQAAPKVL